MNTIDLVHQAKHASRTIATLDAIAKNKVLNAIADALLQHADAIIQANRLDLQQAQDDHLEGPMLKRLSFDRQKLQGVVDGIRSLITLPDPVGTTLAATELDRGLNLYRVACPIGVIGVIFEARPDALVQIATLCLKSGNATVLKGGREAIHTNRKLAEVIRQASQASGISPEWLQLLETRDDVNEMLKLDQDIDLIIPRGSNAFVKYIMQHSAIPVMGHADGICHVYIDQFADLDMAVAVTVDAKAQYVSVCNAAETLLVHQAIAPAALPKLAQALSAAHVQIRACDRARPFMPEAIPATDSDWDTEYLDYIISVKVVDSLQDAISHINTHGSGHTDVIVTADEPSANTFLSHVDSADVFWNCSSRFADGFRFGLGAEVGISTSKLHARGPVGLEGLVTYKWLLKGQGHLVADYAEGRKHFTHRQLPLH